MKKAFFLFILLLFSGCASAPLESEDLNNVYMERCLSTGMLPVALDEVMREETGLPALDGMYIANVEARSAASSAHVRAGDVLLQIGEEQVFDKESFARAFLAQEGNKSVKIKVWRGGGILTLDLPLTF